MQVTPITMEREEALKMYQKYLGHKHWSRPVDAEIAKVFSAIAKGRVVIRALESIRAAGLNPLDGLPKLAIARADARQCWLSRHSGGFQMSTVRWATGRSAKTRFFDFPPETFPTLKLMRDYSSLVPHIPPDIRPKRGIENYHILYEANWSPEYPRDPFLLRRIGKADIWLVVGAWDLTDVEREVLAANQPARQQ